MVPPIWVDFSVYILLGLALLVVPLPWLAGTVLAATVHEICHYAMAGILGVKCRAVHISTEGTTMSMAYMTGKEEILITMAGPMGSFALLIFQKVFPQLAIAGLIQGLFNCIPIYPLDGGRVIYRIFETRQKIAQGIEIFCILGILICSTLISIRWDLGIWPMLWGIWAVCKMIHRKFPCKDCAGGLQ